MWRELFALSLPLLGMMTNFFPFFLSLSSSEARGARFCSLQRTHISAVSLYELASHHNFPLFMRLWHCYIIRVYDVHVRNNFATYAMSSGENRCLWYDDTMQTFAAFFFLLSLVAFWKNFPRWNLIQMFLCSSLIKKMFFLPLEINKQTYSLLCGWSADCARVENRCLLRWNFQASSRHCLNINQPSFIVDSQPTAHLLQLYCADFCFAQPAPPVITISGRKFSFYPPRRPSSGK